MRFVNRKGNTIGCSIVKCRKKAASFMLYPERRPYMLGKDRGYGEYFCSYHRIQFTRTLGLTFHEYADLHDRILELVRIK